MKSAAGKFPTTNAQGLHVQVAAWVLVQHVCERKCFDVVCKAWLSLLMPEQFVVKRESTSECYIVLKATIYASLLWPVTIHQCGRMRILTPRVTEGTKAEWIPVLDEAGWFVFQTVAAPPHVVQALCNLETPSGTDAPHGVALVEVGDSRTLLAHAASHGFKQMAADYIQKLISHLGLLQGVAPKEKPK
eukprot:587268-Amphidinium_carterae.1